MVEKLEKGKGFTGRIPKSACNKRYRYRFEMHMIVGRRFRRQLGSMYRLPKRSPSPGGLPRWLCYLLGRNGVTNYDMYLSQELPTARYLES